MGPPWTKSGRSLTAWLVTQTKHNSWIACCWVEGYGKAEREGKTRLGVRRALRNRLKQIA